MICPNCGLIIEHRITDLDIPEAFRTQSNYWKMKYFEAILEVRKANKGLLRLHNKINRMKEKI